jgi:hypothetical protein
MFIFSHDWFYRSVPWSTVTLMVASVLPTQLNRADRIPDLVRTAVDNQLKNDANTARFRYLERRLGKQGSRTYERIESDAGTLEWLVAKDDRLLNDTDRRTELRWLHRLQENPGIMRKARDDERKEAQRRKKLIQSLPDAFSYEIEAEEDQGRILRLHFRPNPQFRVTSRETQVCRAFEGRFWIDRQTLMFLKAEGKLVRDVNFGWGFLGKLNAGGTLLLEQSEVSPGIWRITRVRANFNGNKLLFKTITIRMDDQASGFETVPESLSLNDATEILASSRIRDGSPAR